jgi:hypothetical protein
MSDQNLDYAAIRRNVEKRLSRQKWLYRLIFFGFHLLVYLVAMLAVWGTIATNSQLRATLFGDSLGPALIVVLPTILWAMVILFHVASLFTETSTGERAMRERLFMREVGEGMLRQGLVDEGLLEKPKRSTAASEAERKRSSADGELIPTDEDQPTEQSDDSAHSKHAGASEG